MGTSVALPKGLHAVAAASAEILRRADACCPASLSAKSSFLTSCSQDHSAAFGGSQEKPKKPQPESHQYFLS